MADEKKASKAKTSKKSDKNKSKKNPFKSIAEFFKDVARQGKKVNWPNAKEVFKNTVTVLVVILIIGAMIYVVDLGLTSGMKGIKQLANTTTTTTTTTAAADATVDAENAE